MSNLFCCPTSYFSLYIIKKRLEFHKSHNCCCSFLRSVSCVFGARACVCFDQPDRVKLRPNLFNANYLLCDYWIANVERFIKNWSCRMAVAVSGSRCCSAKKSNINAIGSFCVKYLLHFSRLNWKPNDSNWKQRDATASKNCTKQLKLVISAA